MLLNFSEKDLELQDSLYVIAYKQSHKIAQLLEGTYFTPETRKFEFHDNPNVNSIVEFLFCIRLFKLLHFFPEYVKAMDYQDDTFFFKLFDYNLIQLGLILILISFFFKLSVAPFHLWSPDVYEESPTSSTLIFAVLPKLAIFVVLLRLFFYSFHGFLDSLRYLIVILIILTVIVGSLGGIEQKKLKSLLAYSAISHVGYILLAFCTGTFEGLQMLISYMLIYMLTALSVWSIFLIIKLKPISKKYIFKQNKDLTDIVLLKKANFILAIIFSINLLSLAGFPPMIGFLVKAGVFLTSIESYMFFVAVVSILCSVIATFYYIRIIKILFFEKVLVGKLYYPILTQKAIFISLFVYMLIFLFINPSLLFLISYKISLLFF
jgi:NADH-quinone oxidoreductase subunit N